MTDFRRSRIAYYESRLRDFSSNGILYLFEPEVATSPPLNFQDNQVLRKIRFAFRSFMGRSDRRPEPTYEDNAIAFIDPPYYEIRCFSSGRVEIFRSPIFRRNVRDPSIRHVDFDGIILDGHRLDNVSKLLRETFNIRSDVFLHIVLFGVQEAFPYAKFFTYKMSTTPFKDNVVVLPSLTMPAASTVSLVILLREHLLGGDIILPEDL